jgi:hypothetical protein
LKIKKKMADESFLKKPELKDPTGARFFAKIPDIGSPTGFTDVWISFEYFISSTLTAIASAVSSILALTARVVILENTISKKVDLNKNADYVYTLNDTYHVLNSITIAYVSGSPIVRIGTTLGGDELVKNTTLASGNIVNNVLNMPYTGLTEIYVTFINPGKVHVVTIYTPNIFNS